jgi:hypothetical protein
MATWVWSLLEAPRTEDEMVAEIRTRYPTVSEDRARADVATLLTDLSRKGFVVRQT